VVRRPALPDCVFGVLLLHGSGEGLRQRSMVADRLAEEGYAVLQAQHRGFAGNPGRPGEIWLVRQWSLQLCN